MTKVNDFIAMNSEAQESSTKRTTEHLESDISKKQKVDENVKPVIDDSKELKKCIEIVPDDGDEFWSTAMAKTINGEVQIYARVDGKEIVITESSVRRDLQLADEEGMNCLPNSTIFEQLALMGVQVPRLLHGMSLVVLWHVPLSA
uniref:Uncharacterized protein n=1 Tax=Tanacetum cinerariifolium TaxID=118510 RepID=A0A6L2KL20_TANCI|nr:hypothetical protein [Tanacetum cinerariifolium]